MYLITVLFVLSLMDFQNGYVRGCSPCFCYTDMDKLTVVLCEGVDVVEFPILPPGIVTSVAEIHISNTLIQCLPIETSSQYSQLKVMSETDNIFWQCTCMDMWISSLPNELDYVSEKCDKYSSSSYVTTTTPITSTHTPTLITSQQAGENVTTPSLTTPH